MPRGPHNTNGIVLPCAASCFMAACWWVGRRRNFPRDTAPFNAPAFRRHLAYASPAVVLPVLIIIFLRFGIATPTERAAVLGHAGQLGRSLLGLGECRGAAVNQCHFARSRRRARRAPRRRARRRPDEATHLKSTTSCRCAGRLTTLIHHAHGHAGKPTASLAWAVMGLAMGCGLYEAAFASLVREGRGVLPELGTEFELVLRQLRAAYPTAEEEEEDN